jgi:hypothetical protein
MQHFQRHIKINADHVQRLYQKDERAPPVNLQNRSYTSSFLHPQVQCVSLPPHFLSLSRRLVFPQKFLVNISSTNLIYHRGFNGLNPIKIFNPEHHFLM